MQTDELLTVREVAQRLRVDDTTVRRWIKNGHLEAIELPGNGKRVSLRISQTKINEIIGTRA